MKELGSYLKRTRISNGVNIAEAAEDLELSITELENIESGNVKAFKDVYELKDYIKSYAKYLGLNPDKITDEFNNFLFNHTSKISLEDIKVAQKKQENKESKKIRSPYTIQYKEKSHVLPVIFVFIFMIAIIFIVIYLFVISNTKVINRTNELSPVLGEEIRYEFTY